MTTAAPKTTPLAVRLSAEQRAALEWHRRLFPVRYPSLFAVLQEHSLNDVVAAYRRRDSADQGGDGRAA